MLRRSAAFVVILLLAGCAATAEDGELVADPYESTNRKIHAFNKGMDRYVVNPAAKGYDFVTPALFQHMISNAIDHLALPGQFVNYSLQGDIEKAGDTLGRFTLNTLMGAGVLDPASEFGLRRTDTDFGLTLASWGVEEGAYIELPAFGPSTTRDTAALPVDFLLDPTTWLGGGTARVVNYTITGLRIVDARERYRPIIDETLYNSEDSYISARSAYIQNRRRLTTGETDVEELPDVFSE